MSGFFWVASIEYTSRSSCDSINNMVNGYVLVFLSIGMFTICALTLSRVQMLAAFAQGLE